MQVQRLVGAILNSFNISILGMSSVIPNQQKLVLISDSSPHRIRIINETVGSPH